MSKRHMWVIQRKRDGAYEPIVLGGAVKVKWVRDASMAYLYNCAPVIGADTRAVAVDVVVTLAKPKSYRSVPAMARGILGDNKFTRDLSKKITADRKAAKPARRGRK